MSNTPMEAECKYRIENLERTRQALTDLNAKFIRNEVHRDTYLRHPSRDFRMTDEALRIREVDGRPFITYKGPRLDGPIKIRPEIELPLVAQTVDDWLKIWTNLGFTIALTVEKKRSVYEHSFQGAPIIITLDEVDELGKFVEIERIIHSQSEVLQAEQDIQSIAVLLGLNHVEPRSYLGMLLAKRAKA